ncbi:GCN5-related N-acetyltransferase [Cellulophaga algicola DSM 14237]|uniref:GCN5-related N-acetyltransferase n=1 Tax=Cellulophaga algicola (strain DSM 14237 / IC166 / ACAM 630) TaxID=688270 RepID=E6X7R1_CELAD|nr:GNAT family N-acetyltransferase [Cellulophaga algicola]ADV47504.1 GCN5-related N-acetyltransferase [Cellulophaga algicola DSM 14237]
MAQNIQIKVANSMDLDGILKLQSQNQISQGGTLSAELSRNQIKEMMTDMPQIVAYVNDIMVGFLLTTAQAVHKKRQVPIVEAMFTSYAGLKADSYIYGPVCVSEAHRGKGLAQLMFNELLYQVPNREGILFIKSDNVSSLRAHEKMGIKKVSSFNFNTAEFNVFSYLFSSNEEKKHGNKHKL